MEDNVFASRAGEKLKFALEKFKMTPNGLICSYFGSSTGGFVDCLLQEGAEKVYSVDTAYGELAWNLRNNPKVAVLERTNAMHVTLPEKADLITIDVGWTKQDSILPNAFANLKPDGKIISLIKPHYESPKYFLRKGRLPDEKMNEVLQMVRGKIKSCGREILKIVESPILGEKGKNREFLALIIRQAEA